MNFKLSHRISLRYLECADVDMGLCVSQFSGPPLDDSLTPSFPLADSPNSPSSPIRKGEAGKWQPKLRQLLHSIVRLSRVYRCCYVRQQRAARSQIPIARATSHSRQRTSLTHEYLLHIIECHVYLELHILRFSKRTQHFFRQRWYCHRHPQE